MKYTLEWLNDAIVSHKSQNVMIWRRAMVRVRMCSQRHNVALAQMISLRDMIKKYRDTAENPGPLGMSEAYWAEHGPLPPTDVFLKCEEPPGLDNENAHGLRLTFESGVVLDIDLDEEVCVTSLGAVVKAEAFCRIPVGRHRVWTIGEARPLFYSSDPDEISKNEVQIRSAGDRILNAETVEQAFGLIGLYREALERLQLRDAPMSAELQAQKKKVLVYLETAKMLLKPTTRPWLSKVLLHARSSNTELAS